MAFQHGDAHRFLTTWQGRDNDKRSLQRVAVISQPDPRPNAGIASSLPDVPGTAADGGPPFLKYVARDTDINDDFQLKHRGIFGGKLQGHPTDPNHWIMARQGAAYVSKTGTTLESNGGPEFEKLELPDYSTTSKATTRSARSPMPPRIPTMSGGSAPPTAGSFAPATPGRTWQRIVIDARPRPPCDDIHSPVEPPAGRHFTAGRGRGERGGR